MTESAASSLKLRVPCHRVTLIGGAGFRGAALSQEWIAPVLMPAAIPTTVAPPGEVDPRAGNGDRTVVFKAMRLDPGSAQRIVITHQAGVILSTGGWSAR